MAQKSIFITGAGSGIGRAVAQRFAREGWRIGLADVNRAGLEETAALLGEAPHSLHVFDVREIEAWERELAAFAESAGGRINAFANNAGVPLGGNLVDLTQDEIDRTLAINLSAVIYGARAAHPWLKAAAPDACMVATCSAAGLYGQAGMTIYCASKFGVRALVEALDAEWRVDGIRARSIMPSFIDTPLLSVPGHHGDNQPLRERVRAAGLEFTPVEEVADAYWRSATDSGAKLHNPVGKTARKLALAAKWAPSYIRKRSRSLASSNRKPMG